MLEKIKTFFGCFFSWIVPLSDNLEEAEVFIAQSYGMRKNSPGTSNEELADEIRRIHKKYPLPLILQWGVADCLPDLKKWIVLIIRKHLLVSGKYLDSREVKRQAAEEMKKRKWKTAFLISQPWQTWRCKRILECFSIRVKIPLMKSISFDRESLQWRTRCLFLWIVREIPTRLYYIYKGWI